MNRPFFTFVVLTIGMWVGTAAAQTEGQVGQGKFYSYMTPEALARTGYNAKGQLPPVWVKNKVTPEQYDTLALLNMLATVDYSSLKGYDTTAENVRQMMNGVSRAIHRFMADGKGTQLRMFEYDTGEAIVVEPRLWQIGRKTIDAQYVLYSSRDGYDAHVLLSMTLHRNAKTGKYVADSYKLSGYSLGGGKVEGNLVLSAVNEGKETKCIEIGPGAMSADFILSGQIDYTDPLGCRHLEQVGKVVTLALGGK